MSSWKIVGSYYETCNCEAVCPCRRHNGRPGGRSSYGICEGLLSWDILGGDFSGLDLSGRKVAMAVRYDNDEPGSPWTIVLYIDDQASSVTETALTQIFTGAAGGNIRFTGEIGTIIAVRRAAIVLDHHRGQEWISVRGYASGQVERIPVVEGTVTCGIPGHDHLGIESISRSNVDDEVLSWSYKGRCGFSTDFDYHA